MQIIIPMTGYGSRFVNKGYKDLKPLIRVNDKPIIEWIVKRMYTSDDNFIFICRKEHIESIPEMKQILRKIAPNSIIYEIDDWIKKGNANDILRASEVINDNEPTIINYCDFYMSWDYVNFKKEVINRNCEGCIPCYTGFHPHLIPKKNLYASCSVDENNDLIEIKEKYSFETDKTKSIHSPGNYYFKCGKILKKYCSMLIESDQQINGEYYISLAYNFMVKDGLKVWIPTKFISYFCQWGTPEDLEEYLYWINIIKRINNEKE